MSAPVELTYETKLLERIAAQDEAAFFEFHGKYINLVFSMALKVLQNQRDAEEVAQDVFMTIWHRALTYDSKKGKITTWLLTITRRRAIDLYRKRKSRTGRDQPLDTLIEWLPMATPKSSSLDLRDAFVQLPEAQQEIINLIYFEGYTQQEAADKLGIPLGTVKGRVRLGMEKLRTILM